MQKSIDAVERSTALCNALVHERSRRLLRSLHYSEAKREMIYDEPHCHIGAKNSDKPMEAFKKELRKKSVFTEDVAEPEREPDT